MGPRHLKRKEVITTLISHMKSTLNDLRKTTRMMNDSKLRDDLQRSIGQELDVLQKELGIDIYRERLSKKLSLDIQSRLHKLQNPSHCEQIDKLHCTINNQNGLASGLHDLMWCQIKAYFSGSMLVLSTARWHYTPRGWHAYFQPLTQRCHAQKAAKYSPWPGDNDDQTRDLVVHLPVDLAEDLLKLGSNPLPWWYGQFLGFSLKPNSDLQKSIDHAVAELDFRSPIVGVHIRRSDKIGPEASYHDVDEYMIQVQDYFQGLADLGQVLELKRVFLATDDNQVVQECINRYPDYRFLYNANVSSMVGNVNTRYNEDSVIATLVDVFLLAKTDYIVCTFSSGFCRLAYELMQFHRPNSLDKAYSLDTEFFYAHITSPMREAIYDHVATRKGEIDFSKGDLLQQPSSYSLQMDAMAGKVNDGLVNAFNTRTNKTGFYPAYKAVPLFELGNTSYT